MYDRPLPYNVVESNYYSISSINPSLPDTFSCQFVVNGVAGPIANYSNEKFDNNRIWESGSVYIVVTKYSDENVIRFAVYGDITINTLDVYIDGVKMNLTQ